MKLGTVIGRVTLNAVVTELEGARWLIVCPFTREHLQRGTETPAGMSKDPSWWSMTDLGGGVGQTIGYVEGREAAHALRYADADRRDQRGAGGRSDVRTAEL